jgi:serine/threonine protein kinase
MGVKAMSVSEYQKSGKLSSDKIWRLFRQLVGALDYYHNVAGIPHRNINLSNILMMESGNISLLNSGISLFYDSDEAWMSATDKCQSTDQNDWHSPNGMLIDILDAGMCLYTLTEGLDKDKMGIPNLKSVADQNLRNLLERMLQKSPKNRYSIEDIKVISFL